jgi:hypothetical protein
MPLLNEKFMGMWVCTYDQAHVLAFKIFGRFYVAFGTNIFLSPSFGTSNATKITQLDEGMTKICFFDVILLPLELKKIL